MPVDVGAKVPYVSGFTRMARDLDPVPPSTASTLDCGATDVSPESVLPTDLYS